MTLIKLVSCVLPGAISLVLLLATAGFAQMPGVHMSGSVGLGLPSQNYESNCGDMSIALSLNVQGRRRIFPQLSLDHFTGSAGGDDLCLAFLPTVGAGVGGIQVDGATRLGLGAGARAGSGMVQIEGAVLGGFITGRRGFQETGANNERTVLPHVGAQASLVLFRHVVLSYSRHTTRLRVDFTPAGGGSVTTRRTWSPMSTLQAGVRVSFGER